MQFRHAVRDEARRRGGQYRVLRNPGSCEPGSDKDEIEGVIAAQGRDSEGGLIVMPDVSNDVNRELIIALAARYRVRAIYFNRFFSELGGLISFGVVRSEQLRLAPGYIDRIPRARSLPTFRCRHRPSTSL